MMLAQDDAIAFAEKVLALLQQGAFSSTYKFAVLIGLIDLALEGFTAGGAPPDSVTTRQLAGAVTRLYWPQVASFEGSLLRQNTGREAVIVSRVAATREQLGGISVARAQRHAAYEQLLCDVEWTLVKMPLPKLQRFGGHDDRFIYEIAWDDDVTRREFNDRSSFQNLIRFRPNVAEHLVRLDGLLRPLLHRDWAMQVASINRLPLARLTEHLFGVDRAALGPIMPGLRELQGNRCFYCDARMNEAEVDHFLPWARVALDAIENLVAAHAKCNRDKTDHLAAAVHLERWRHRLDREGDQLTTIAAIANWETNAERAIGVARGLYLPLRIGARVWSRAEGLVPVHPGELHALLAA